MPGGLSEFTAASCGVAAQDEVEGLPLRSGSQLNCPPLRKGLRLFPQRGDMRLRLAAGLFDGCDLLVLGRRHGDRSACVIGKIGQGLLARPFQLGKTRAELALPIGRFRRNLGITRRFGR